MNFNEITSVIENGEIARRNKMPSGTFIFKQVPSTIPKNVVPNMTSLPIGAKKEFEKRFDQNPSLMSISYINQWAICDSNNLIKSYCPSIEDIEATDWITTI